MNTFFFVSFLLFGIAYLVIKTYEILHPVDKPKVVVNMPADAKPLDQLKGDTIIGPEKATLWWSVYNRTFACEDSSDSIDAANAAVKAVYGDKA